MSFLSRSSSDRAAVRPAAVAGLFYPDEPSSLSRDVDAALASVTPPLAPGVPKAMIVPHAGYVYSGPVAASAYARLAPARDLIKRVVLLGPCHRVPVRGLALPQADAFETPLGRVAIDANAVDAVSAMGQVVRSDLAHADEHALEVQLPFLQRVLGDFTLVPFVVGAASAAEVAQVIERLWGGPETLVLVSSDLSHYHRYDDARAIDGATVRSILDLDSTIDHEQACGATPLGGLLELARRRRLLPQLLDARNSGDTAGDKRRVVGYAAFAFWEGEPALAFGDEHGRTLLRIARGAIAASLGRNVPPQPGAAWLEERRATFVTLRQAGELRGCIGSLEPRRALAADVAQNAIAAAFSDPRFRALTEPELDGTDIELSLLSGASRVAFASHGELVSQLVPERDGVILSHGERRSTFLPQVWEQVADAHDFLAQLKRKAGLAPDFPSERCDIHRYRVLKWTESELGKP
jgi:AmmeMemoRadiSam system protein B/AmmeMemoRadiSam system protein A